MDFPGEVEAKREAAAHARRVAGSLSNRDDVARLVAFAERLEAQADDLEDRLCAASPESL